MGIDILEPTIGNFVRQLIPGAPRHIEAAFAMQKGAVVDMPKSSAMRRVVVGLGWDTTCGEDIVDVSAVMLNSSSAVVDTVFFGKMAAPGVTHSGDNLTGHGDGDDEQITVEL